MTSNLKQRIWQHRTTAAEEGFAAKYGAKYLVWYECHVDMENAIFREKAIKKWRRVWKIELIETMNPEWRDLSGDLM